MKTQLAGLQKNVRGGVQPTVDRVRQQVQPAVNRVRQQVQTRLILALTDLRRTHRRGAGAWPGDG